MLKTTVIGNLGFDAETKMTRSGKEYIALTVAHDKGKNTPTTWVRVSWFNGVGHPLLQYLKKGAKLCCTGDLSVSAYTDRNGNAVASVDLFADSVDVVLFPKREDAQPATGSQPYRGSESQGQPARHVQAARHEDAERRYEEEDRPRAVQAEPAQPRYMTRLATDPIPGFPRNAQPADPREEDMPDFLKD